MTSAQWVLVAEGNPKCVHKWEPRVSFVYGQMRICAKKRCRQSERLHEPQEGRKP